MRIRPRLASNGMNLNLSVKLHVESRALENTLYFIIVFLFTAFMAILIYSVSFDTLIEESAGERTVLRAFRPDLAPQAINDEN
jgi:hypothetical protein